MANISRTLSEVFNVTSYCEDIEGVLHLKGDKTTADVLRERFFMRIYEGESLIDNWIPLECAGVGFKGELPDFLYLGYSLYGLSPKALNSGVKDFFEDAGELLPISVDGDSEYRLLYVSRYVEALDRRQSGFRSVGSREICNNPVFKRKSPNGLFRVPQIWNQIFLGESKKSGFKEIWQKDGLYGINFRECNVA